MMAAFEHMLAGLDNAAAQQLQRELISQRGRPLLIDASQIQTGGTPGFQVLLSVAKTWQADAVEFGVVHPSEAFLEALQTLGIDPGQLNIQLGAS
jgi:chemotaxis protein CheX